MSIIDSCCHDCESCVNDMRTVLNNVGLIMEDILTKTLCIYDAVGLYIHNNVTCCCVVDDMFKSSNYSNFVGGGCNLDSLNFNMLNGWGWRLFAKFKKIEGSKLQTWKKN